MGNESDTKTDNQPNQTRWPGLNTKDFNDDLRLEQRRIMLESAEQNIAFAWMNLSLSLAGKLAGR